MIPVQVKVWKWIQPISEPELPYVITLLAVWRCLHYEHKKQNDTVVDNPPFIVSSLSLK